jgi:DNA invertase Pin-like site-specific DNA recombinase
MGAWQARYISKRTREGLAAAQAKGVKLGRPALNVALQARATELRRQGLTLQGIADTLNNEGHTTATGAKFRATTVYRMVNREDATANPEGGRR